MDALLRIAFVALCGADLSLTKMTSMLYKKILIAVDSSSHSFNAARKGFELAHQLRATIGLIHAVDRNKEVFNVDLGITPEQSQTVLLKQAEENIEQLIRMYDDVEEVFRFTPEGFPEKEIISIAKEWGADLIVIGAHRRTGLSHWIAGGVADYVIKHADVPVFVVSKSTH
jgi:nucleotide-binding universal stress UspA family protein